jgi:hypothetical protein
MNWNEYLELSEKTLSTQFHCTKDDELLLHSVMGILTEVEELLDNHMTDSSDEINRSEEIADIWWYVAIIGRKYNLAVPHVSDGYKVNTSLSPMEAVLLITKKSLKLLDFLKKKLYYNKPINEDMVILLSNEIVSLLYAYAAMYEINTEMAWDINIAKLKARYGDKFSSERAINRDLNTERNILEGKQ